MGVVIVAIVDEEGVGFECWRKEKNLGHGEADKECLYVRECTTYPGKPLAREQERQINIAGAGADVPPNMSSWPHLRFRAANAAPSTLISPTSVVVQWRTSLLTLSSTSRLSQPLSQQKATPLIIMMMVDVGCRCGKVGVIGTSRVRCTTLHSMI
jgi:hypothetical protein